MTNPPDALGYLQPHVSVFPAPIAANRAPASSDVNYPIGQSWIYADVEYTLTSKAAGAANWESGAGSIPVPLTVALGGTGRATATAYGVIIGGTTATGAFQSVAVGTAGQVLTSNGAGAAPTMETPATVDLSSPPPIGDVTPNTGAFTELSTDGSGTVNLESSSNMNLDASGDIDIQASGNITISADIVADSGFALDCATEAFSITAGDASEIDCGANAFTITASNWSVGANTLSVNGTISADAGSFTTNSSNFIFGAAGDKTTYSSFATTTTAGANSAGTVALVGGTATVATTAIGASSRVRLTVQTLGTVIIPFAVCCSARSTGVSFTILSADATDTSTVLWEIIN